MVYHIYGLREETAIKCLLVTAYFPEIRLILSISQFLLTPPPPPRSKMRYAVGFNKCELQVRILWLQWAAVLYEFRKKNIRMLQRICFTHTI